MGWLWEGCGVVWCGVVWGGVVWCGVVWCGVVWCGVGWGGVLDQAIVHHRKGGHTGFGGGLYEKRSSLVGAVLWVHQRICMGSSSSFEMADAASLASLSTRGMQRLCRSQHRCTCGHHNAHLARFWPPFAALLCAGVTQDWGSVTHFKRGGGASGLYLVILGGEGGGKLAPRDFG